MDLIIRKWDFFLFIMPISPLPTVTNKVMVREESSTHSTNQLIKLVGDSNMI